MSKNTHCIIHDVFCSNAFNLFHSIGQCVKTTWIALINHQHLVIFFIGYMRTGNNIFSSGITLHSIKTQDLPKRKTEIQFRNQPKSSYIILSSLFLLKKIFVFGKLIILDQLGIATALSSPIPSNLLPLSDAVLLEQLCYWSMHCILQGRQSQQKVLLSCWVHSDWHYQLLAQVQMDQGS